MGIVALLVAYAAGSLPSAYLAGRLVKGVDLRTRGSRNLGATNVYREVGAGPAAIVLTVDVLKGALPVVFLPPVVGSSPEGRVWWAIAFGLAAIAGHARSVFLGWRGGGKGVATGAGVFAVLIPLPLAIAVLVFVIVVALTRFVSLGSLVAALMLPVASWLHRGVTPPFWASVIVAVYVVWSHRENIARLRAGTERRLGRSAARSHP
jgi:glycerol-3-phosphate acyltransferase PlsY